jgi:hypothetical protein
MKKNIFAFLTLAAVVFGAVGFGFAQTTKDSKKARTINDLLTLLPASEAAMAIDAKRLFGEALPQVLSGNQPLLSEILRKFDEIKSRSGVDYKQFQQVAVGVSSIKTAGSGFDFETLVLARGQFNSAGLMTAAKAAANGKFREEKIGERTVYVFSPQDAIEQNKAKVPNSKYVDIFTKMFAGLNREMALTSYDNNTLVLGSLARVRELFESTTPRISAEVLGLVSRKPNAIANFGALLPTGLTPFMELDDDNLGKSLAGIRQLSGAMDIAGGNTIVSVAAKTAEPEQAKGLKETIEGFQSFLPGVLKSSKGEDKKVYARMLENARVAQNANEVTLDLQVPQADINVIIGEKK